MTRKALALLLAIIAVMTIAFTAAAEDYVPVPEETTATVTLPEPTSIAPTTTEADFVDGILNGSLGDQLGGSSDTVVNGMFSIQNILQAIVTAIESLKQSIVTLLGSLTNIDIGSIF